MYRSEKIDWIDYRLLYETLDRTSLQTWMNTLPSQVEEAFQSSHHGDLPRWRKVLRQLPDMNVNSVGLDCATITIGGEQDCTPEQCHHLKNLLKQLSPWRKGPYKIFGIPIDSEWRSDIKWNRLTEHIQPLTDRLVLDVGCGNGYHCWRMLGEGAKLVIGIDPTRLNVIQFHAVQHFTGACPVSVLPLGIEDLPPALRAFDTVFSMGVLYHRRSPIDHLIELQDCLKPGGELILETLVIDGVSGQSLVPEGRYAKMRNVWFIPSCETLISWMKRCGFGDIRLIDVSQTTPEEQRSTEWMQFQSLSDFLDPDNPELTCEGLPAPKRAIFMANSP